MAAPSDPITIIPARLAATRLPNKPLADIHGQPMIVHVWRRAVDADVGRVVVAAGDSAIVEAVRAAGGEAVATDPGHASGSDRIREALEIVDPERRHDVVLNVQGDLPTVAAATIRATLAVLSEPAVDIATAIAPARPHEVHDPNVVKAVVEIRPGHRHGRALYFTRATAPSGDGPLFHHIGLYAYRRGALERFVAAPPGMLEQRERLEQLRALAIGMRIDAALVDEVPLGVDTEADLDRARDLLRPARP